MTNFELYNKSGLPRYTPEELVNLMGLIAIMDAESAKQQFSGIRSLDGLEDYICDHVFTD